MANSGVVRNEGEQYVQGRSEEGYDLELVFQISDVGKTLLAVRKITAAGNRVVFDEEEGSYILHKPTGAITYIEKKRGTYSIPIWILVPEETRISTGMFDVLGDSSEEEKATAGFRVGA